MIFNNNTTYQTLRILIAIFGALGMTAALTPMKKSPKKNLLIWSAYVIYAVLFTSASIYFWGFLPFLRSAVFTISLPGVIANYLISDSSPSRQVFNCLSQLLLSLYLIVSVTLLNTIWGGTLFTGTLLLLLTYCIVGALEFFFLRNIFLNIAGTITKGWGILALIPSSFFIITIAIVLYPTHYTQNPSFLLHFYLLGIVVLIIYYAIFQYMRTQYKYQIEEQSRELLALQIQSIKNTAADTQRKAEEVKKIRQDTNHILSHIAHLAETGDATAILSYISEATVQNSMATPVRYCKDPFLNATLINYLNRAENSGITVELHLSIPEILPVDSADLSICFANALENAIKACEKLPQNERKIAVKCIHKPTFMFEIGNSYQGRVIIGRNGLPQSREKGHGIGTRSIMAFCQKHNAFYAFAAENGWFTITVTL